MAATVYSNYINFREYNRKFENPIYGRIFYFFIHGVPKWEKSLQKT